MNSPVISEAEFQEVANLAPVILWRIRPDGYCDWFNQAWLDFTGTTAEEELGFGWMAHTHPDDEAEAIQLFKQALKNGQPYRHEYRAKNGEGEYRWMLDTATPYVRNGEFAGFFGSTLDITRQKFESMQLQLESEEIRNLFQQAPGFIAWGSGPEHRLGFVNKAFEKLVGRRGLVGKTVKESMPELAEQGFLELLDEVYASGTPHMGTEVPIKVKRGNTFDERYVDFVYQPIFNRKGEVAGIFASGYDVTSKRRARDDLQKLQMNLAHMSRLSAMGTMASTLAHELNQPLTAIGSYLSGCDRMLQSGSYSIEQVQQGIREARNNVQRASEIIRSVREMTKRRAPQPELTNLGQVVAGAAKFALVGAREQGISRAIDVEKDVEIEVDPVQLQQVFVNLIRNSLEAMEGKDRQELTITGRRNGNQVHICIKDSGSGIAAEDMGPLFEPFHTTKEQGLGIGLPICRTIVEAHGGRIWVEDTGPQGTSFCITLPVRQSSEA
jgi:two-component system, LuxR family, sensor kinase FixL